MMLAQGIGRLCDLRTGETTRDLGRFGLISTARIPGRSEFLRRMKSLARVMVCLLAARIGCAESGKPVLPDHPRYGLQHLDDRLGLNTRTVTTFLQDHAGFLWIGTQTGLLRFDGSNVTTYGRNEGLLTEVVDQLALDPDGKVWVGSEMGLAKFDGASFHAVPLPSNELKANSNYQLFAMDWQGGVFVGTTGGLLRFDYDNPANLRLWTPNQGLA